MSKETEDRKILKKRWRYLLSNEQRQAWNVFAQFCPEYSNLHPNNPLTGKEMFILCNLSRLE